MSRKQKESKNDQQQFWQMVFEIWQDSGMAVSKFCKAEGLSEGSFYNWRKKLAKANAPGADKQTVLRPSAFIEVAMPKNNPAALELVLSSGNILRISSAADSKTLINVLSALREVRLC
ncbi:hypothetical protein LCGC14_1818640 [marine sediment metagenome]|uniref:Transposase n=1 Tax=marine sediment metagenome TaxID=412755 RepID=A0A0F9GJM5_9ZZZZ